MEGSQESSSVGSRQSTSVSHIVEAESDASDVTIFYPRVLIIDSLFARQFLPVFSDLQTEQKGRWSLPFRASRLAENANGTDFSFEPAAEVALSTVQDKHGRVNWALPCPFASNSAQMPQDPDVSPL